jgi:uridine monophosphate synthetase
MCTFLETLLSKRKEKKSLLCVGLDPALPGQREKNLIPEKYLIDKDENNTRLEFCLKMVDLTSEYCCAFKPNLQYVLGWTREHHTRLTTAIRKSGAVSILDCKLGDIGDTIDSAIYHIRRWGYDAITFNPFLGNIKETVEKSHKSEKYLGILVLTLTSNREAIRYQKEASIRNSPLFLAVAKDVEDYDADGCVLGATDHITEKDIREVRSIVGPNKVFLIPGIGTQRGDLAKLVAAGRNILVNVSRDIIYSQNPSRQAQEYCTKMRDIFQE